GGWMESLHPPLSALSKPHGGHGYHALCTHTHTLTHTHTHTHTHSHSHAGLLTHTQKPHGITHFKSTHTHTCKATRHISTHSRAPPSLTACTHTHALTLAHTHTNTH